MKKMIILLFLSLLIIINISNVCYAGRSYTISPPETVKPDYSIKTISIPYEEHYSYKQYTDAVREEELEREKNEKVITLFSDTSLIKQLCTRISDKKIVPYLNNLILVQKGDEFSIVADLYYIVQKGDSIWRLKKEGFPKSILNRSAHEVTKRNIQYFGKNTKLGTKYLLIGDEISGKITIPLSIERRFDHVYLFNQSSEIINDTLLTYIENPEFNAKEANHDLIKRLYQQEDKEYNSFSFLYKLFDERIQPYIYNVFPKREKDGTWIASAMIDYDLSPIDTNDYLIQHGFPLTLKGKQKISGTFSIPIPKTPYYLYIKDKLSYMKNYGDILNYEILSDEENYSSIKVKLRRKLASYDNFDTLAFIPLSRIKKAILDNYVLKGDVMPEYLSDLCLDNKCINLYRLPKINLEWEEIYLIEKNYYT